MKRIIVLVCFMFFTFVLVNGQMRQYQDVVYLKDGGVIKGVITDQTPGQNLKIKTGDGNILVYPMAQVARITKEENLNYFPYPVGYQVKNPAIAWVCSFFIPGLGQMVINEQYLKGAGMFVGVGVGSIVSAVGLYGVNHQDSADNNISLDVANTMAIGGLLVTAGIWLWSMVDAPLQAKKINRANLFTWELGESTLKLRPDFAQNNTHVYNHYSVQPTVGMRLSLEL